MQSTRLESRLLGKITTSIGTDDSTLMAERKEKTKEPMMRVKEDSEKLA